MLPFLPFSSPPNTPDRHPEGPRPSVGLRDPVILVVMPCFNLFVSAQHSGRHLEGPRLSVGLRDPVVFTVEPKKKCLVPGSSFGLTGFLPRLQRGRNDVLRGALSMIRCVWPFEQRFLSCLFHHRPTHRTVIPKDHAPAWDRGIPYRSPSNRPVQPILILPSVSHSISPFHDYRHCLNGTLGNSIDSVLRKAQFS